MSGLGLYILTATLVVLTPGPNMVYLTSQAVQFGRRSAFIAIAGTETAFLFHLLAVATGFAALLRSDPRLLHALRLIGAVYLLYLAYRTARPRARTPREARKLPPRELFMGGFLSCALNPQAALFYLTILPQFLGTLGGSLFVQSVKLGLIHIALSTMMHSAIVTVAGAGKNIAATRPGFERFNRLAFATLLCLFAVKLAVVS